MGAILNFLFSERGLALTAFAVTTVWGWFRHKDNRAEKIAKIARDAFLVVEKMADRSGWKGEDKWLKFVETIVDAMNAQGLGKPSGTEIEGLRSFAFLQSWLVKPPYRP